MDTKEINEKVAKALGWTEIHTFGELPHLLGNPNGATTFDYPNEDGIAKVPNYSGSIEAAWEIVEHLRGMVSGNTCKIHGTDVDGVTIDWDHDGNCWTCTITPYADSCYPEEVEVQADTAPMAICLAFLKLIDSRSEAVIRRVDEEGERD